jgi:hypothetical protein
MEIKFKLKVDNIAIAPKLDNFENVVTKVSYSYIASEENKKISISYPIEYEPDAPDKEFKSFEKLEEADVISWITKSYNFNAIESYLIKKIEEEIGTKYIPAKLPWENNTPEIINEE